MADNSALLTPQELRQRLAETNPVFRQMFGVPESLAPTATSSSAPPTEPTSTVGQWQKISPEEAEKLLRENPPVSAAGTSQGLVRDPALGRSADELVADSTFNPVTYAQQFPESMKLPGMREVMAEILERKQTQIDENPLSVLPKLSEISLSGAVDTGKLVATGGLTLLKNYLKNRLGLATPEEYRRSVATGAAALETAGLNTADLLRDALKNPLVVPQLAAARMAIRKTETPEQRKTRVEREYDEAIGWTQTLQAATEGKGPVTGSVLGRAAGEAIAGGNVGTVAVSLASGMKATPGEWVEEDGLQIDPGVVSGSAVFLDPVNFVPVTAGAGLLKMGARVIARGPVTKLAAWAARNKLRVPNLPTVHGVVGKTAAGVAGGVEKAIDLSGRGTLRGVVGGLAGAAATGDVTGAVAGAVLEPVARLGLRTVAKAGQKFAAGRGVLFGTYDTLLRQPLKGAAHGLVATYPIAALTPDPEKQKQILSAGAGLGAVGGLVGAGARAAGRGVGAAGAKLAEHVYSEAIREPVQAFDYATDSALDAAHRKGQARQTQLDARWGMHHAQTVDVLRNRFRFFTGPDGIQQRVEIYNLTEPDFLTYAGEQAAGAFPKPVIDSNGQPVYRIFLNAEASPGARQALYHEPGHMVSRVLKDLMPEQYGELQAELGRLDPEALDRFKMLYEARRRADLRSENPQISAEELEARSTLTPAMVLDEAAAELLGALLRGHPLDGLPAGVVTRTLESVGAFLEGSGLYKAGPLGTPTTVPTSLGFSPSFRVGKIGRNFLAAVGLEGSAARSGAGEAPPVIVAAPKAATPKSGSARPPVTDTPPAAEGGFGTVPPAVRKPIQGAGAAKKGNFYTDRPGQGMLEADWWSDSSWDEALEIVNRSSMSPKQKAAFQAIYDYRKSAPGPDLPPLEIAYESAKPIEGTGKPATRRQRRSAQNAAYLQEALGALPEDTRELFQKLFLPYRVILRNKDGVTNVNFMAMSPDKVLGNAVLALREAHAKGRADLVPYENSNGQFTAAGARQFAQDLGIYSSNHAHGYAGNGDPVTISAGYEGQLPEVDPNYRPTPLSRDQADFINLAMGIEPPRTGRKVQQGVNPLTGKRIETPRNIAAAQLAEAQGRPLASYPFAGKQVIKFKGEEVPIREPNPLRQQFSELGIELDRVLSEVTEEINLENIKGIPTPRLTSQFRQPSTGFTTAGLLPRGERGVDTLLALRSREMYDFSSFTEEAARLGRSIRDNPNAQQRLQDAVAPLEALTSKYLQERTPESIQRAIETSSKQQFIRETLETARDEGSMKGIFDEQPGLYVDVDGIYYNDTLRTDIEAMKKPDGPSGTTINADGTPYTVPEGAKLDIVTLASENIPLAELDPERVALAVVGNKWERALEISGTKLSVLKFTDAEGREMASIDLNVLADQAHRENTTAFAKANNQIAAVDLVTFESIPTGGTGDTVLKTPQELRDAAAAVATGKPYPFGKKEAGIAPPSGALAVPHPETPAEGTAFMPKERRAYHFTKYPSPIAAAKLGTKAAGWGMHWGTPEAAATRMESVADRRLEDISRYIKQTEGDIPSLLAVFREEDRGARTIPANLRLSKPFRIEDLGDWSMSTLSLAAELGGMTRSAKLLQFLKEDFASGKFDKLIGEVLPMSREDMDFDEFLTLVDEAADEEDLGIHPATRFVQEALQRRGYDSLIYQNRYEGVRDAKTGRRLSFQELRNRIDDQSRKDPNLRNLGDKKYFDTIDVRGSDSFIVFSPEQVKSPFGEGGAFMPKSGEEPALRYSWEREAEKPLPPARVKGELQNVAGKKLSLVHLSSTAGLSVLRPEKPGKGRATATDLRGLPKTFFYEEGSPLGQDAGVFHGGEERYTVTVDGREIYDITKGDPQRWLSEIDRETADERLIDAGYSGLRIETADGRKVVAMFGPTPVKLGGKFKGGETVFLPAGIDGETAQTFLDLLGDKVTAEDLVTLQQRLKLTELRRESNQLWRKHPEALRMKPRLDNEGNPVFSKKGTIQVETIPFDFESSAMVKRLRKEHRKDENAILAAIVKKGGDALQIAKNLPAVKEGLTWYADTRRLLREKFGDDADLLAQLLASTSPRNSPHDNFLHSLEVYNRFREGAMDNQLTRYLNFLKEWDSIEEARPGETKAAVAARVRAYWREKAQKLLDPDDEGRRVSRFELQNRLLDREGILPHRSGSEALFGINSRAILDVLTGNWLTRSKGKKVRQFYGNLVGKSFGATIDIWASRWLHRLLNEGETAKRWRILPRCERAPSSADFTFAQKVFEKIAADSGILPDALQAILWFWEKDVWDNRGWMRGIGAQKQSFVPFLEVLEGPQIGPKKLSAAIIEGIRQKHRKMQAKVAEAKKPA